MEVLKEPERNTYSITGLVRDGVFESMKDQDHRPYPEDGGGAPFSSRELFGFKLAEEQEEFRQSQSLEGKLKEAADVMAAWDSYERVAARRGLQVDTSLFRFVEETLDEASTLGIKHKSIRRKQAEIKAEKGEFDGEYYVATVSPPHGDKWDKYYRDNPSRFPTVAPR